MKTLVSIYGRVATEYYVFNLKEPVKINFLQQVEDVIVSSPDIDVLIGWDYENDKDFTKTNSMLLKPHDNMKEISKERCTNFYIMPRNENEQGVVYVTAQR